ncbi:MAG: formylglycine-generating enzyme family protein, partial [Acidobacteriota bacterium]
MSPSFIKIPSGSFLMGDETGSDDEKPVHPVSLDAFELGKFAITNEEFVEFANTTCYDFPDNFLKGANPRLPATHINWFDAVAYCRWLSETTGVRCRLPYEAEWEYAARSGSTENIFPWGARGWNERPDLH